MGTLVFKEGSNGKQYYNRLEATLESKYGQLERHETPKILFANIDKILEILPDSLEEAKPDK